MKWGSIIAAVLILSLSISIISISFDFDVSFENENSERARISACVPHATIFIDGNAGFLGANASTGISKGSGTAIDPYVIDGWEIDAQDTEYAIRFRNTNAFATIQNCKLFNASTHLIPYGHGIKLDNVMNLNIINNEISDCYTGIISTGSNWNVISRNTVFDIAHMGIQLYSTSSNNTLDNNSVYQIDYNAICLWMSSNDNRVLDNNASSNTFIGVEIRNSGGNLISRNLFEDDQTGVEIYTPSSGSNNTLSNNLIIHANDGIRLNGDGNIISSNVLLQNSRGIWAQRGDWNKIYENNFSKNLEGIHLTNSSHNEIYSNIFWENPGYGVGIDSMTFIDVPSSTGNVIWNNTFDRNRGSNVTYNSSRIQACDSGLTNWWNSTTGLGNYWSDWTAPDVSSPFGIVDIPYNISGSAGAQDFFPLTMPSPPIPEFTNLIIPILVAIGVFFAIQHHRIRRKESE